MAHTEYAGLNRLLLQGESLPAPAEMAAVFGRIRAAVLEEATRPSPYDATQHATNQAAFTAKLATMY